jgi:hypothetical protein
MQRDAALFKRSFGPAGPDAAGSKQPLHPGWNNKNNNVTTAAGRINDQGGFANDSKIV